MDESSDITRLLQRHHQGDREAFDRMVPLVYERLRVIARGQLARAGRRGQQTLDTTALVQEAYLQLVDADNVDWQDRGHFFAICARAMRRILVDHARHQAAKRGGDIAPLTLEADMVAAESESELVLAVDEALKGLEAFNERLARVVEAAISPA